MPGTSEQRFAQLPLSATELEQLAKRLRAPKSYTQLAADRMQFGGVIESYPWHSDQAEAVYGAFNDLQALHDSARLERLAKLFGRRVAATMAQLAEMQQGRWRRVALGTWFDR